MSDAEQDAADRRAWLEREIAWYSKHLESVERDQRRAPFLLFGLLLAIPAAIVWSWFEALLVVLATLILTTAAFYLTSGHRSQYRQKIADLQHELNRR